MLRCFVGIAAIFMMAASTQGSIHLFECTDVPGPDENPITVVGDGIFELAEAPTSGFKYATTSPLTIMVLESDGGGGSMETLLDLTTVNVNNNFITMIFSDGGGGELRMVFDETGTVVGDPVPFMFSGETQWNSNIPAPSQGDLAGAKGAKVSTVPEPSALAFGAIAVGLVGIGRYVRRRLTKAS